MASVDYTLTPNQAEAFLHALAEDDDFRLRLQEDPKGALAQYGINVSEDAIPVALQDPDGTPIPLEVPPRELATWALNPGTDPSPQIVYNPPVFGTCTVWGITLEVAARTRLA